ncbi:hypothetical protein CQW23_17559 [Capsicum baccatum]|uniref:Uncharacterized protein n=1 Tax=Capsicum baccatum TaxID=33114 RepID=A0A2G2WE37_CAPBA|nr:hypothetical protein CQW23_17559 [Capsicum baccatum]
MMAKPVDVMAASVDHIMTCYFALGCKRNPLAFDIIVACSGFMLGLVFAACYIIGDRDIEDGSGNEIDELDLT